MKKKRFLILLALALILLPATARADFGPKPFVIITVTNPPEEVYYLDLLTREPGADHCTATEMGDYDAAMVALLFSLADEGWYPMHASEDELWGLTAWPDDDGKEQFNFSGFANNRRIIVVTESGKVTVSEPITRRTFHTNIRYDYAANKIRLFPIVLAYPLQFAATCIPTLLIEGFLLWLFRFTLKKSGKVFLITNVATQVFLTATLGTVGFYHGALGMLMLEVPIELLILIAEAIVYARCLTEHSKLRRVLYAITANLASFLIGLYTATYSVVFLTAFV